MTKKVHLHLKIHLIMEIILEISPVSVNFSENAIFQENLLKWSDLSKSCQLELDLEQVSKISIIPVETNIQDDACKNLEFTILENADLIKTSATKSTFLNGNDSHEHLVSAFDESALKEGETPFDTFEDFVSSGSEYVPCDYSLKSTSDTGDSEIFDVKKVEKTYSKVNPTEHSFRACAGLVAKNEVTHILLHIVTELRSSYYRNLCRNYQK